MSKEDSKVGYSDALGGYGVPSQVEITGGVVAHKKPRGRKLVFRPKPKNMIILAAIAVAVVLIVLFVGGVIGSPYSGDISEIKKNMTTANGVPVVNYQPTLTEGVDWSGISDRKREGIAKYAVKEALKQAEADQANEFNIMGLSADNTMICFMFYEPSRIVIIVDGVAAGETSI
jgi:hypothetical protein